MLRHSLIAILLILPLSLSAQIKKKTVTAGTSIFYWNNKNTTGTYDDSYKQSRLNLSVGRAIRENLVLGLSFGYTPIRQDAMIWGADTLSLTYDEYVPGIFARHYKKLARDFYFFAQLDGQAIIRHFDQSTSIQGDRVSSKQWGAFLALTPGVSYQLYKWLQVELALPNVVSLNYMVMNLDFEREQIPDERHRYFFVNSALDASASGAPVLGFTSIGFRFMF